MAVWPGFQRHVQKSISLWKNPARPPNEKGSSEESHEFQRTYVSVCIDIYIYIEREREIIYTVQYLYIPSTDP